MEPLILISLTVVASHRMVNPLKVAFPSAQQHGSSNLNPGSHQAGFIDATTEEAIVSAEFIKDRLIVYFERSTWELAYTGNEIQPFNWYKINTELRSESTFSTVPFDKIVLSIGNTGIHACSGANVERSDAKIPDEVFQITDANNGFKRVCGIRHYFVEMVYWAYPNSGQDEDQIYPNKVLVYNYKNSSWSINDDTITALGYFEQQSDTTWVNAHFTWASTNNTWSSGVLQSEFRQVMAGNQQGYTFLIAPNTFSNASVMQITNMTYDPLTLEMTLTIMNHTLQESIPDTPVFIQITGAQGVTYSGPGIYEVVGIQDANTIQVYLTSDDPDSLPTFTGTYIGGGTVARVSNINFKTKQWNFYQDNGQNIHIQKIDFNVTKTTAGSITVDYSPSFTKLSMIDLGKDTGALMGNNTLTTYPYDPTLVPLETYQTQLWHPVYFQTKGETVQLSFYFTPEQLQDPSVVSSNFELNALIVYAQRSGRLQ